MQGQFAAPQSTFQIGITPTPQGTQGTMQFPQQVPQGVMQFPSQGTTQFPQQVPQGAMPFHQQGAQQGTFVPQGMLSQQALQAQQMQFQQRQQALILEQQVKAESERKRREFEAQRQKLASMDFQSKPVLNPLTDLFGKKPAAASSSGTTAESGAPNAEVAVGSGGGGVGVNDKLGEDIRSATQVTPRVNTEPSKPKIETPPKPDTSKCRRRMI